MDSVMQATIAALLGLMSGLIGGYFSGKQQSRHEREKEARLAVAELAKNLGAASHSMAWLTWKSVHRPARLKVEDIDVYDQEVHALLPLVSGSLAVVSALSGHLYLRLEPFVNQLYKLDEEIAKAGTRYLEMPAEGLKLLSEHHQFVSEFASELNRKVAEVFQEQRRGSAA
jgi:hypothetical protein